ncbi:MAG: HD domain-containing protein [Geobacter sp.]|nr:HD domain-containing protein [Geobacter sp.]
MEQSQLDTLYSWFDSYVEPYLNTDPEGVGNIRLKIVHTRKVCDAMALLSAGEGLSPENARIAQSIALLHDVGRFPQYQRWRTFRDSESDNHARLAIDVIREEKLLAGIEPGERLQIEEAVRFHNLLELPGKFRSPSPLFINLIRDADKLDIWRVFVELQNQAPHERASAATLGFADLPDEVSETCVQTLMEGSIVRLDSVRTLNDFRLLQISWVYDLTCATARRLLLERGYITALAALLPEREDIRLAVSSALSSLSALSA